MKQTPFVPGVLENGAAQVAHVEVPAMQDVQGYWHVVHVLLAVLIVYPAEQTAHTFWLEHTAHPGTVAH